MRSREHLAVALKPRKRKLPSKDKSNQTIASGPRWSRVTISHGKKPHSESDDTGRSLSRFEGCSVIDANDPNVIACDIVELLCESSDTSNEERTACSQISSSTELEEDEVCSTCKDCAECQLQQRNSVAAKIRKTKGNLMSGQDEELVEHLDYYYESDVGVETASVASSSTVASMEHREIPIVVDLTSEESKQIAWKQTILKRFSDTEESLEMSEPRIMIADTSNRLQRGGTGSSLATALRDRGPCVIPVQPNRSLPIRPAPPTPTRSAASIVTLRKTLRSPILKLSKSMSLDVVEVQSDVSPSASLTNELNEFSFGQQNGNGDRMMLTSELIDRSDYILPDMTNVAQITKEVNSVKRKNGEDREDKEYEKEIIKDVKKRKKSHELDVNHIRDERVKNILKEYSRTCSDNLTDKGERKLQQHVVVRLWDDKRYSSPVVVSTTKPEVEKTKEICNKVVPPLRLKKIVREASATDEYRNVEVNAKSGNESNYRIVTGATPRPDSPSRYSAISFWSSVTSEKELESPTGNAKDKSRRASPKSDGYKIKYRRNRLRQKLKELRGKALELSREMTACNNADTSPQRSTRLRQMMNCYEKQIENISKLLCKLSASIPPTTDDVVDLDYENELNEHTSAEKNAIDSDDAQVNGISRSSVSSSPSPEPPKLSPRSPIDYEKGKSPDEVRNSPPVLPRVYIAIQPTALESLKQNLAIAKSWHKDDSSPNSPIEKEVKMDDTDQTIISGDVTTPVISSVSSSEFEDPRNSTAEWDGGNSSLPNSKLKNSEIDEKIPEDTKTFDDIEEHRQGTPSISSDSFLNSTMDIEIDGSDMTETKEESAVQEHLDVMQTSETTASDQVACEKQEPEQKSNEALPSSSSIVEEAKKVTEYGTYNSEERNNSKNRTVTSTVAAAQETSTMIGRPQVPAANVTNILQLQSNYYGSSVAQDNVVFTGVIQNPRDAQKVNNL
ncbi:uncharacterized protein LOC105422184 [Pogonomyrmex barbatus]|uniref:Uncharacterized protein LOC105422184 n=1 Tax=Pogonomyrmex barbatus TaxID=144034 RepID=A0A6I9WDD2_9HYME|nr:uncharacterized protein LOC105422184 [Pogonomyrmex barbatus]